MSDNSINYNKSKYKSVIGKRIIKIFADGAVLTSRSSATVDQNTVYLLKIRQAQGFLKNLKEVVNSFRYGVNKDKIESAHAALSRIQSKACGLFNVPYLFLKLRQCFYQRI